MFMHTQIFALCGNRTHDRVVGKYSHHYATSAVKGLTKLTPEIDWTAMGLPLVTSAVFLTAKKFWQNVGVWEEYPRCLRYSFGDKA
jgi:hypothetical protein